jgi:hypothetical protein
VPPIPGLASFPMKSEINDAWVSASQPANPFRLILFVTLTKRHHHPSHTRTGITMKRFCLVLTVLNAFLVGNGCAFNVLSWANNVGRTDHSCHNANRSIAMVVGGVLAASGFPTPAFAEEIQQYAELPPPYIPVIFGLGLLVVRVGEVCHVSVSSDALDDDHYSKFFSSNNIFLLVRI